MPSNPGRGQAPGRASPQAPRRGSQSRDAISGRITQRGPGSDQIRQRQAEQQRQAAARAEATRHRLRQQQYLREADGMRRREESRRRGAALDEQVARLTGFLQVGLGRSARIDLDTLRKTPELPPFDPGPLGVAVPEPVEADFTSRRFGSRWGGRGGRERRAADAREAYDQAREQWRVAEREREEKLAAAARTHEERVAENRAETDRYNSRITRIADGLRDRDPNVVESFLRTVLRRVLLPAGFPRRSEVTHDPYQERAVIRMVVPGPTIVPATAEYECEPPRFQVRAVPRPDEEIDAIYRLVLAQIALLVVRDVFEAESRLDSVSFEGLVDTVDPATGAPDLPCVVRLQTDRDAFEALDLAELSPTDAVYRLGAEFIVPYASQPA